MYIAILGRQPKLGVAELERVYSSEAVDVFSPDTATILTDEFDISRLGGTLKAGRVVAELSGDWRLVSKKLIATYAAAWSQSDAKITLGLSAYGFSLTPRDVQKTGIILKGQLKKAGVSLRLVPNTDIALSSATSYHNKLGLSENKVELLIVRGKGGKVIVAESTGAQNITAYTKRDQERPKRDAFVGMLPPKLAQIMISLAHPTPGSRILDPFCGTGVILQEAALQGYRVYGTDLSEKMVQFTNHNLQWLKDSHHVTFDWDVHEGDAMTTIWQQPVDAVVGELYLGQAFSAPPSPSKLAEVRRNCDHIISSFLKNLSSQIESGIPLCVAIPAWKHADGSFTHLPLVSKLSELGYQPVTLKNVSHSDLLYYREDQVVARQLLVLHKK